MGFGAYAVPAAEHAFKDCDCLLAIGTRFSEIPTGSFSMSPPQQLIHMDINSAVFNKNYPATVTIEGDAKELVPRLLKAIKALDNNASTRSLQAAQNITSAIKRDKEQYMKSWYDY